MENIKEVYYHEYCSLCVHKDLPENEEPCEECLTISGRIFSHKPEHFEPSESNSNN